MTKSTGLAELVDAFVADYSADAFLEDYMADWTFGQIIEFMYEVGEIPTDVIEKFIED